MLTRGGADRIDGADRDRAPGPMPRPALGSGGEERGIPTAGVQVGIPTGARIRGVTIATGIAADTRTAYDGQSAPREPLNEETVARQKPVQRRKRFDSPKAWAVLIGLAWLLIPRLRGDRGQLNARKS